MENAQYIYIQATSLLSDSPGACSPAIKVHMIISVFSTGLTALFCFATFPETEDSREKKITVPLGTSY